MNMCELRRGSRGRAEAAGSERRAQWRRRPGEYPLPDRLPSPGAQTGATGREHVGSRTRAEAETRAEEVAARGSCPTWH